MKGNIEQAIELLEFITKTNPEYDTAQFSLGHTYLQNGNFLKGWQQHDRYLMKTNRYTPIELKQWIQEKNIQGNRCKVVG